jgi:hypothetical protein
LRRRPLRRWFRVKRHDSPVGAVEFEALAARTEHFSGPPTSTASSIAPRTRFWRTLRIFARTILVAAALLFA